MTNKEKNEAINEYIQEIKNLLPYSETKKGSVFELLKHDIEEAMMGSNSEDLSISFGKPDTVAKNLCLSQRWGTKQARFTTRIMAYIIDFLVVYIFFGLIMIPYIAVTTVLPELKGIFASPITSILLISFLIGYFTILEKKNSTTLGKKLFNLLVVDITGVKITWKQALVRNFSKFRPDIIFIDILIGKLLYRTNEQSILDILTKTNIIKQKTNEKSDKQKIIRILRTLLTVIGILFLIILYLG